MVETAPAADSARKQFDLGRVRVAALGIASSRGIKDIVALGIDSGRLATPDDHFDLFFIPKPINAMTLAPG
jgi:hypothetical protein